MIDQIIASLGRRIEDVAKDPIITSLNVRPKMSKLGGTKSLLFSEAGLDLSTGLGGLVENIFFHAEGHEGYKAFAGPLPEGLQFSDSRGAVRTRLGSPTGSSKPGRPPSDRYDRGSYVLFISYAEDECSINLVTIMAAAAKPKVKGKSSKQ
jgi:hypothetical protein